MRERGKERKGGTEKERKRGERGERKTKERGRSRRFRTALRTGTTVLTEPEFDYVLQRTRGCETSGSAQSVILATTIAAVSTTMSPPPLPL